MRRKIFCKKGFSVVEYGVLILAVALGLAAISAYLKAAIGGNWRSAADVFGFGHQYSGSP